MRIESSAKNLLPKKFIYLYWEGKKSGDRRMRKQEQCCTWQRWWGWGQIWTCLVLILTWVLGRSTIGSFWTSFIKKCKKRKQKPSNRELGPVTRPINGNLCVPDSHGIHDSCKPTAIHAIPEPIHDGKRLTICIAKPSNCIKLQFVSYDTYDSDNYGEDYHDD